MQLMETQRACPRAALDADTQHTSNWRSRPEMGQCSQSEATISLQSWTIGVKTAPILEVLEDAEERHQLVCGALGRLADCCRTKCGWKEESGRHRQLTEVDDPMCPGLGLA